MDFNELFVTVEKPPVYYYLLTRFEIYSCHKFMITGVVPNSTYYLKTGAVSYDLKSVFEFYPEIDKAEFSFILENDVFVFAHYNETTSILEIDSSDDDDSGYHELNFVVNK